MRFLTLAVLFAACLALPVSGQTKKENKLPDEVVKALHAPEKVTLYALEPEREFNKPAKKSNLYGYEILGEVALSGTKAKTALDEFEAAVARSDGTIAMCFEPHHALRVVASGHSYDLLLCYSCLQMYVYKDGKFLVGDDQLGASGTADTLNNLLKEANVPLSYVYSEAYLKQQKEEQEKQNAIVRRWITAIPKSLHPFMKYLEVGKWDDNPNAPNFGNMVAYMPELSKEAKDDRPISNPKPKPKKYVEATTAMAKEFPDESKRIRVLLGWFGSGAGPWSGYSTYEDVPEEMLLDFATPAILKAIATAPLSVTEMEGAARLFGSWHFSQTRPDDLKLLSPELKKVLLQHVLKTSKEEYNIHNAKVAFE